jgi:hypothetical protein
VLVAGLTAFRGISAGNSVKLLTNSLSELCCPIICSLRSGSKRFQSGSRVYTCAARCQDGVCKPGECIKRKLPTDLQVECAESKGLTGDTYGYMIAQLNSPTCPPARPSNHDGHPSLMNAWLSQKVSDDGENTSLAVCADDHNVSFGWVVRRFKNVNCPPNKYVEGGTEGLTGWIILLNPPPGATITVCAVFTAQSFKPFGPNYAAYHKATRYSELCGGTPNKPNSFGANFGVFTKGYVHVW